MKRFFSILVLCAIAFFSIAAHAEGTKQKSVLGGFELSGYLDAGFGWQRFSNDPVTEFANDGSFAGVLGSVISNVNSGIPPAPGQDDVEAFVEVAELDIAKSFGDRAKLRADVWFGRPLSGSWVAGADLEQAYLTVTLWQDHALEFTIGRFGTAAGFEPYDPYNLDTISWSIVTRAQLYPYYLTGAQLSFDVTDNISIYIAAANGVTVDTNAKDSDVPGGIMSIGYYWGPEDKENSFVFTPYISPDSDSNRHFSFGADATLIVWATNYLQIAAEGIFHRDNAVTGGVNTNYAAGLLNLHWDMTDALYGVLKYSFAKQFAAGNGFFSRTGAQQQIHEASVGLGYLLADGIKFKWEGRLDIVAPTGAARQWVPGTAIELACAF